MGSKAIYSGEKTLALFNLMKRLKWSFRKIWKRNHPCFNCEYGCPGNGAPDFFDCHRTYDWEDRAIKNRIKNFYHKKWLPFTFNKKRILFLTIAAYIALC
jgi:hypothetical protein